MVIAKAKAFARVAGWVGLLLGGVGFLTTDLLGMIQFDLPHNLLHLLLGFMGIAAASQATWSKYFTYIVGPLYVVIGVGAFFMPQVMGIEFEAAENLIHLILGTYGVYVLLGKAPTQAPPTPPQTEE